jgi:hypothetical protein
VSQAVAVQAVSLLAPFGTLVAAGKLRWLVLGHGTGHRGLLAIHQRPADGPKEARFAALPVLAQLSADAGVNAPGAHRLGAVLALVRLQQVVPAVGAPLAFPDDLAWGLSGWLQPGDLAWRIELVHRLPTPMPLPGQPGLFRILVPESALAGYGRELAREGLRRMERPAGEVLLAGSAPPRCGVCGKEPCTCNPETFSLEQPR